MRSEGGGCWGLRGLNVLSQSPANSGAFVQDLCRVDL